MLLRALAILHLLGHSWTYASPDGEGSYLEAGRWQRDHGVIAGYTLGRTHVFVIIYAFCWRCQREGGDVICNDCTIHSAHARHMYVFFTMCVSPLFLVN